LPCLERGEILQQHSTNLWHSLILSKSLNSWKSNRLMSLPWPSTQYNLQNLMRVNKTKQQSVWPKLNFKHIINAYFCAIKITLSLVELNNFSHTCLFASLQDRAEQFKTKRCNSTRKRVATGTSKPITNYPGSFLISG